MLLNFRLKGGDADGFGYRVRLRWGGLIGLRGRAGRFLEAPDGLEGAVVAALGGIDAAMEAGQRVLAAHEGAAGRDKIFLGTPRMHAVVPDLGLGLAEAAELPLGGYHGIDEEAVFGAGGLEAVVVFEGEGFEDGGDFAGDNVGASVNAGFEGIEAGNGLAFDGTGAGGFLRIEAVRLDLEECSHDFCFESSRRVGGRQTFWCGKCCGISWLENLEVL
jgi:hypothetical protein